MLYNARVAETTHVGPVADDLERLAADSCTKRQRGRHSPCCCGEARRQRLACALLGDEGTRAVSAAPERHPAPPVGSCTRHRTSGGTRTLRASMRPILDGGGRVTRGSNSSPAHGAIPAWPRECGRPPFPPPRSPCHYTRTSARRFSARAARRAHLRVRAHPSLRCPSLARRRPSATAGAGGWQGPSSKGRGMCAREAGRVCGRLQNGGHRACAAKKSSSVVAFSITITAFRLRRDGSEMAPISIPTRAECTKATWRVSLETARLCTAAIVPRPDTDSRWRSSARFGRDSSSACITGGS